MMAASREDIAGWLRAAKASGASHMLVICDTFDHSDYPVNAVTPEDALARYDAPGEMQRVMEVYDMGLGIEAQLSERRALHLPEQTLAPDPDKPATGGYGNSIELLRLSRSNGSISTRGTIR